MVRAHIPSSSFPLSYHHPSFLSPSRIFPVRPFLCLSTSIIPYSLFHHHQLFLTPSLITSSSFLPSGHTDEKTPKVVYCPGYIDPEHPDDPGTSALDIAKAHRRSAIVRLIKDHVATCTGRGVHEGCKRYFERHKDVEFHGFGPGVDPPIEALPGRRGGAALSVPGPRPSIAALMHAQANALPAPLSWPVVHSAKAFAAAAEANVSLMMSLVETHNREEAAQEEIRVLIDNPGSPGGGGGGGRNSRPRPPLVDPIHGKHPTTLETTLHVAARHAGGVLLARYLLSVNADPNAKDRFQATPLWFASERGRLATVKALAAHMGTAELRRAQGTRGLTPSAAARRNRHHAVADWIDGEIVRRLRTKDA